MMKIAVNRLSESARPTLAQHFLALPMGDLNLRFGMSLAPSAITAYVDQIDLERDAVLGVHDDRNVLVGVAHVAVEDNHAELALSVLPVHRRRGIASALLKRAIGLARSRRIAKLFMHFLTRNTPIMRLAQKFRMDIVESGSDADAYLDLQLATSAPVDTKRANAFDYNTNGKGARRLNTIPTHTHWSRILYHDLFSASTTIFAAPSRSEGHHRSRYPTRIATILLAVFSALSLVDAVAVRFLAVPEEDIEAAEDNSEAPAWAVALSTPLISAQQRKRP